MQGNIRSFWYGQLEPLLIDKDLLYDDVGSPVRFFLPELPEYELGRNDSPEEIQRKRSVMRDLYLQNTISEVLGEFVKQEVFTFREGFGFADQMCIRDSLLCSLFFLGSPLKFGLVFGAWLSVWFIGRRP